MQENDYTEGDQIFEKKTNSRTVMLLANKQAIQSLLNEKKPFNYLRKYFEISSEAIQIVLFNLFYFQTAKQVTNIFIYSQQTIANYIYKNYQLNIK